MPSEQTNFNVKIDSKVYEELKAKVKSDGMNMTAFLRLAIRNYDLLVSLQESNEEKNNDFFLDMNKRMNRLEKDIDTIDFETLQELLKLYQGGGIKASDDEPVLLANRRGFNIEED